MTCRIHRSRIASRIVFVLSGDINHEHAEGLEDLLAAESPERVLIDLKDVTLVDRATIQLLARAKATGVGLVNCPEFVHSWIAMETFDAM
jgi:anti-anti-sigma regulatory factor